MSTGAACAQSGKLAPEGRGLLAPPAEAPAALGGAPPPHRFFEPHASGMFNRDIFVTTDDPGFVITVRKYSFPPNKQLARPTGFEPVTSAFGGQFLKFAGS
jgi:hypothetical protein